MQQQRPVLFEEEYPEEAAILVKLLEKVARWGKRFFFWDYDTFGNLEILIPPNVSFPERNEPCRCGSGIKFKKCCRPLTIR